MTQTQLADKAGLDYKYVNDKVNFRNSQPMELNNAKSVAMALDCTIDDLYEWEYAKR